MTASVDAHGSCPSKASSRSATVAPGWLCANCWRAVLPRLTTARDVVSRASVCAWRRPIEPYPMTSPTTSPAREVMPSAGRGPSVYLRRESDEDEMPRGDDVFPEHLPSALNPRRV